MLCQMLGMYVDCKTPPKEFEMCFKDTHIWRAEHGDDEMIKSTLRQVKSKCCWLPLVSSGELPRDRGLFQMSAF